MQPCLTQSFGIDTAATGSHKPDLHEGKATAVALPKRAHSSGFAARRDGSIALIRETGALTGVQENGMADDRNWLVDHTGIGVSEIFRSAKFYEAALRPLGIEALVRIARNFKRIDKDGPDLGGVGFGIDYPVFWVERLPSSWR
jgi:hypothetical protein